MQLDWSTFALQVLNFLVLVWLLKRFLYTPVFEVIADRKARIERIREEAEQIRQEGEKLRSRFEQRLTEWASEKEQARAQMLDEIQAERIRLQEELRISLEHEREKAVAREARRQQEVIREIEESALRQASRFAARLLARLVNTDVHARILELAIEELHALPEERRQALRTATSGKDQVSVMSAYPMNESQRLQIQETMTGLLARPLDWKWSEASELMGGLRITLGPWVLAANVRDELKFFAETAHDGH
jgi:F-type H+-transporting ATPase subunit b